MTEIFVGVDTNILINFGRIEDLRWDDLFPGVTIVNLLISITVQKEMDEKKDKAKGYVQKRAKEFQRLLTAAEETDDYVHRFTKNGIAINICFLNPVKRADLDGDQFDIENADSKIVAEYFYYQKAQNISITLLSNDGRTVRDGKTSGMTTLRPKPWEEDRLEPESENERRLAEENRELKRQLGARPSVGFKSIEVLHQIPADAGTSFDWSGYLHSLGAALKGVARPRTEASLIDEFGLEEGIRRSNFTITPLHSSRLTQSQLDEYRGAVDTFFKAFDIPAIEFFERLRILSKTYILDFSVENTGAAPEETIFVELALKSTGVFVEPDDLHKMNDWSLTLPEEPRPYFHIHSLRRDTGSPDEVAFWSAVQSNAEFRQFHLSSLLHGHSEKGRVYVFPKVVGDEVKVLITLRAKNLLEPITRSVVLKPSSQEMTEASLDQFLMQRSAFLPDEQRTLLRKVIMRRNSLPSASGG